MEKKRYKALIVRKNGTFLKKFERRKNKLLAKNKNKVLENKKCILRKKVAEKLPES